MTVTSEHTPHCLITTGTGPDGPYTQTWPDDECDHPNHSEARYQ